jgi:hypothetical protein
MRNLFLIAAAVILLGSGSCFAQVASNSSVIATSPSGVANPLPPVGSTASPLGTIRLNPGALMPTSPTALGSITACPTTGIASLPPTADLGGSAGSPFGTSAISGTCGAPFSPTSPAAPTGSAFSDGAIPLEATEAGGSGLSPLVAVPPPASSAPACSDLTIGQAPNLPSAYDSTGATDAPSVPGC